MIFQYFPIQMYGMQIWPCCKTVKGQPMTIIWTNLVDLEYPMLYIMIKPQSFLGSAKEDS